MEHQVRASNAYRVDRRATMRTVAIGILAATSEDRAALRLRRIDPNKTTDAA
jgi:hypothetical protein